MQIIVFNAVPPHPVDKLTSLPSQGFAWIDCTTAEINQVAALVTELNGVTIHDRHLNDCMNPNHPCFFDSMQNYDFLIFRNLTFPPETLRTDTHPACFFLFNNLLVTVTNNDNAITQIHERCFDSGRRQPSQPEILLQLILNTIMDNFLALRFPLTDKINKWQTLLLSEDKNFNDWDSLFSFQGNIRQLINLYEEQQDALGKWRNNMDEDLTPNLSVRLNDTSNHILRVLKHAASLEKQLETLIQLHYSVLSEQTNKIIRVLTVISAVFLPLTLITNIFGMNFQGMIGINHPSAFYITLVGMLVIAIGLVILFRWRRWI